MSLFIILFFVSLLGIIFMITKSLVVLNNEERHYVIEENFITEVLDLEKLKDSSIKNFKRGGHTLIWIILRTYIVSSNFINKKRKEIWNKIKEKIYKHRKHHQENAGEKEPSKYLKMISEYREKIKRLKHRIKEEEGIE